MPCMPVVKVVKRKYQYFLTCLQFFKAGKANSVGLHLLVSQRRVVRATKTAEKNYFSKGPNSRRLTCLKKNMDV